MRRYDDPVEVRRGAQDDPEQFLWRGRLWQVREVVAHWVETGAWWVPSRAPVTAAAGTTTGTATGTATDTATGTATDLDLLREREVWRVAAARGRAVGSTDDPGFGVFDLVFSWSEGHWVLARAVD